MKAVILAAGRGSRFGVLTATQPKALIEVAGKALIRHVLDAFPDDITEVIIVIGYLGAMIERALGADYDGRPVRYVYQKDHLCGTGGALLSAREFLEHEDRFLVTGADDIFDREEIEMLIDPHTSLGKARETIDEPWASYGVHFGLSGKGSTMTAVFSAGHVLTGFRDIPDHAEARYFGVGSYVLPKEIFDYQFHCLPNGEYSIPHTLAQTSFPVYCVPFTRWSPINNVAERNRFEAELGSCVARI